MPTRHQRFHRSSQLLVPPKINDRINRSIYQLEWQGPWKQATILLDKQWLKCFQQQWRNHTDQWRHDQNHHVVSYFLSRLRIVARCWLDTASSITWFLWARTALKILTWLMNVVRKINVRTKAMTRNIKKRFEDKVSSVATTNSVTLTPATTTLITASVAKREKYFLRINSQA